MGLNEFDLKVRKIFFSVEFDLYLLEFLIHGGPLFPVSSCLWFFV
jgi:hypothetical protein